MSTNIFNSDLGLDFAINETIVCPLVLMGSLL